VLDQPHNPDRGGRTVSLDDVLGAASQAEQEGKDRVADARAASDATSAEHEKTMRIFA
jgi:hypothetical protein